tara:strand:- start:349 stop:534 length:186 start_codon:yes stop_codon:yes gene_type:complete
MSKVKNFRNMEVTYRENIFYMVEVLVWDLDSREQASVSLDMEEVLKLKYFLEDSLKDFCND